MHAHLLSRNPAPHAVRFRLALLGVLGLAALVALAVVPPFPQDPQYHDFADQRPLLGVPHALNVLSNLPFVVFGVFGMAWLLRPSVWLSQMLFPAAWQRWAFLVLFVGVTVTGFGS